jgi:deoxyribodipyrimidine photolyase
MVTHRILAIYYLRVAYYTFSEQNDKAAGESSINDPSFRTDNPKVSLVCTMDELNLPEILRERINPNHLVSPSLAASFVLYLPTVVLRKKHNPGFALACRLANHYRVPLIVLVVVLDDSHMPSSSSSPTSPIVMTARRLTFLLQALQSVTQEWERHGAGVAIRVHGPQARTPHHLTLARHAMAVVTDEPFVHPYLGFCQAVERATNSAGVPCYRVDGSTTVPPVSKLQKQRDGNVISYKGVPSKAWMWQKMTESKRKAHVYGVVKKGHFDAPELSVKLEPSFFLSDTQHVLYQYLPSDWRSVETPAPGRRPWTIQELATVPNIEDWALSWPGADASVPPCPQTHGSLSAGEERWNTFLRKHLSSYAKQRNQIQKPHAVSRMSCYLNFGIVSIFQVIYDLWQAGSAAGANKFQDEIVKWREMSYAHAFSASDYYNQEASVPQWARRYLDQCRAANGQSTYPIKQLDEGRTGCDTWNAMQRYLVRTGELHNNARMTWGKTLVHWQKGQLTVDHMLQQLCYLNDRYALDGLSPPSYAGLLWCVGWCDKPKDGILSNKPSSRYRVGRQGFEEAEQMLLATKKCSQRSIADMLPPRKKQRKENHENTPPADLGVALSTSTLFPHANDAKYPNTHVNTIG